MMSFFIFKVMSFFAFGGPFMKTLTVRRLDERVGERLKDIAAEGGISVNELILRVLSAFTGVTEPSRFPVHYDLDPLAGGWNVAEEKVFNKNISPLSEVDEEMWQ